MAGEQETPAEQSGESGDESEQAVAAVGNGLAALAQAEPQFQSVLEAFSKVVEDLQSGGQSRAPNETTTPEQGGNPNAVPMSMGRPG